MDLYKQMRNIRGNSNKKELEKCINIVRERLDGLTEDRTCKIYNGELYKELLNNHVPAKLMNTKELNMDYEHVYVLVLGNAVVCGSNVIVVGCGFITVVKLPLYAV